MAPRIILLYEPEQIDIVLSYLDKESPLRQEDLHIIALNYEVELILKERGISYYSIQNYLEPAEVKDPEDYAIKILQDWLNAAELDFFQYHGIRLLETRGRDVLMHYIRMILFYLNWMNCIFKKYSKINKIYIPQSSQFIPSTAGPVAPFTYRILVDVVMLFGKVKGISVSVLPLNKQQFSKGRMLSLRRRIVTFLFEQGLHISNFIITISRPPQKLKIFVIDHWRNIKPFIQKMDNVELVMMVRKEIKNMEWEIWNKRVRFCHPKDFLTADIRKIACNKQMEFRSAWQAHGDNPKFSKTFYYQGISFWPVVKFLLDYLIMKDAERVICEIESIKRLLLHFSINRVLLRAAVKDEFYLTAKIASQLKIPSLEVQHGLVIPERVSLWTPIKVDYLAVYGKLTREILVNNNNEPRRIVEVGSPRFDQYLIKKSSSNNTVRLRESLNINSSRPVVLIVAPGIMSPIEGAFFTSYELRDFFLAVAKLQDKLSDVQIIIKLRPTTLKEEFYRKLISEVFQKKVIVAQYENTGDLIDLSDVVLSYKSTVILEAMIFNKPVILFTLGKGTSGFQLSEKTGAIRIAYTLEELFAHTRSLISDEKARKDLVKNANAFLKKHYLFDGKSSDRIINLLKNKIL